VGSTNLKQALISKMGLWAGELKEREAKAAEILTLYEGLPAITARAERLKRVLDCASEVMREIDPAWSPDRVKPSKPFVHKAPVQLGQTTKLALDVLREAPAPLRAREIAVEVLRRDGREDASSADVQRVTNSVDAALRQKNGRLVAHDGGWPKRWRICLPETG